MTKVILASVISASVTIMASVTYGKRNLWQVLLMAKILWQMKLSPIATILLNVNFRILQK